MNREARSELEDDNGSESSDALVVYSLDESAPAQISRWPT